MHTVPVTGVAAAVMTDAGHAVRVHATDEVAARLDEVQFELGEGPAREAFGNGYPVLMADIGDPATAGRWPAFTHAAREAGAAAVFALPLQLGAIQVGALLMYRTEPGELDPAAFAEALRIADSITYVLVNLVGPTLGEPDRSAMAAHDTDPDGEGPMGVLIEPDDTMYRAVVHQAAGMLSAQLGVSLDEALARLRAHAFAEGESLTDVARAVVTRTLRLGR